VRLMDLDPFEPVGITTQTMRFLDVFLLHCLLSASPPDSPEEIAALARNQHRTAARGREPGLLLERDGKEVTLTDWGHEIVAKCAPLAAALDAAHGTTDYSAALAAATVGLNDPSTLPSARVLAAMAKDHDNSFVKFVRAQSEKTRAYLQGLPFSNEQQAHFKSLSLQSMADQKKIEAMDSMPFEMYRKQYVSAERLNVPEKAKKEAVLSI
jgi:glutamate--cysteine ligase